MPVPVTLQRLAVARFVLIFGLGPLILRDEHHRHAAPLEPGRLLDRGYFSQLFGDVVEHLAAELGVGDRAAAEEHGYLHPVPLPEEGLDVPHLELDVVDARLRSELHFLELEGPRDRNFDAPDPRIREDPEVCHRELDERVLVRGNDERRCCDCPEGNRCDGGRMRQIGEAGARRQEAAMSGSGGQIIRMRTQAATSMNIGW